MPKVVITGGAGNLGGKLRRHFERLGWELHLLDAGATSDPAIHVADLSEWRDDWVAEFRDADAVVHLAADPSPNANWASAQRLNLDLTLNVYEAAVRQGARRLVFASSNWVVAGHRFAEGPLTTDMPPYPVNPYGVSKLVGERLGRSYSDRWGLSVICFRIGWCQSGENLPGEHMWWGRWGQSMWLSDRDFCQGVEKAILAPADVRFAVLNLMSRNDGMRWDLEPTRRAIGYEPLDQYTPTETEAIQTQAEAAARDRRLIETTEARIREQNW